MLNIPGPRSRRSGGISRRNCLQIGGLALGGLALPEILRGESASRRRGPAKGIIMVLLPGGPSHLDTFDLKPEAPVEIRGEFQPIATNVPGIEICELLPRLAKLADKYAIIRSLVATLYHQLGIDVASTQLNDLAGRPQYLVGAHRPLPELIG